MTIEEWKERNNVFIAGINADNKIVAAGWFNLDNEPTANKLKKFRNWSGG